MSAITTRASLATALAVVLVVSGAVVAPAAGPRAHPIAPPAPDVREAVRSPAAAPSAAQRLDALEAFLRARGVPDQDVHPPDLGAEHPNAAGPVAPTYSQGPAPMGVADLGLRNDSGSLVPYSYNTSSVWGSVTLTTAQVAYGDAPAAFSIQLDAVATNVTLRGVGGYEFWTEDYASYSPSDHQLTFGDNIWNFSNASAGMSANVFASHGANGTLEAPYFYYASGRTFTVEYPFTVDLFLNVSHAPGPPSVFFNYSLTTTVRTHHGSTDDVTFASLGRPLDKLAPVRVPPPAFQVSGAQVDPVGLPNDLELVLVGDGNGATTTFFSISATVALRYWDHSTGKYAVPPAAFDAGCDAAETSNGILPVYHAPPVLSPPTVTLLTGPSFVDGLWNVSGSLDGSRQFHVGQRPQNAFLFISPGATFDDATAQWVPTLRLGTATSSDFSIPNDGSFQFQWLLSDWTPIAYGVNATSPAANTTTALTEHLVLHTADGSYTPLLAWGNSELAAISSKGNGSATNPFVLIHRPIGPLDPLFGQLNDFDFPVFAGVFLVDTTDYVRALQTPVTIDYGSWTIPGPAGGNLPKVNQLQLEFWNVSHVAVENSSRLGGWLAASFDAYPLGAVVLWNSTGDLVANSTFYDPGVAVSLYGGTNNTVWGNRFLQAGGGSPLEPAGNATGLVESEAGDLVYNNYFAVPRPALTPTVDALSCKITCAPTTYTDRWNVSLEPAGRNTTVLGDVLTGSILGTWYQGGNYWSNYGTPADPLSVLPYDDSGLITVGGDYVPLYPSTVYSVTIVERGLEAGTLWNVTVAGLTTSSSSPDLVVDEVNGSYTYSVGAPPGYLGPSAGSFTVNGSGPTVLVSFTELFSVTVGEAGLLPGWSWNVTFNATTAGGTNRTLASSGTTASGAIANGTYEFRAQAYGYAGHPVRSGSELVVDGQAASVELEFTLVTILSVTATGLPAGAPWTVLIQQGSTSASETGIGNVTLAFTVLEIDPGAYSWTVSASGYAATPADGSGTAPNPSHATVAFRSTASVPSPGFDRWMIAFGAAAVLAGLGFVLFALERTRSRRPPPMAPASLGAAAPRGPGGSTAPAAWEEGPADSEVPSPPTR